MTHDEMIAVIQAHKDGKQIQIRQYCGKVWADSFCPRWNFEDCVYRVKPEPRVRWHGEWTSGDGRLVTGQAGFDTAEQLKDHFNADRFPIRPVKFIEVLKDD
jgi:hypothetical protein